MKRVLALGLCLISTAALAGDPATVQASNGVAVTVYADDFANWYEYDSPKVTFKADGDQIGSLAFVSMTKKSGVVSSPVVVVLVTHGGDWHFYNGGIFKGGETIEADGIDGKVLSCRYGCSYVESVNLRPTKAQIAKYTENGVLPFQVRSKSSHTAIFEVPASYFDALNELASK